MSAAYNNNKELTLEEKLYSLPTDYDPNRTNFSIFNDAVKNVGSTVAEVSKVFVDTGAEVTTMGIKTGENAAKMEGIAAANVSVDLAATAADIAKTKLPGFFENVKEATKVVTEGIGEVNNVIDTTTLEMEEASINAQIATMMASRPGLTEEEARRELEEAERLEREKEEIQRIQQFELEKAKIEVEGKVKDKDDVSLKGGSNKKQSTLKNIQKGGKMAAKRTQKSIHDFLKPSITSSSVLKLMKGGKKSAKRRRYNYGLRSKRRR